MTSQALALDRLFDTFVTVSASEVTPGLVDTLAPLASDETPLGFDSWVEKRRREFRSGRHHARAALLAAGGPERAILRDADGVPLFPEGFHGSITHTGRETTFVAAAVARTPHRIGIDAEELRDLPTDMVEYILSETERARLQTFLFQDGGPSSSRPSGSRPRQSRPPSSRPFSALLSSEKTASEKATSEPLSSEGRLALLAFSAKEAFYKCIFPDARCRLGFHDVEFSLTSPEGTTGEPGSFTILLRADVASGVPRSLSGKFITNARHVVCGVEWRP